MEEVFLAAPYVTAPQMNVASGIALAIALLNSTPEGLGQPVQIATRQLRGATEHIQTLWAKQVPRSTNDARPFDNGSDVSWGALIDRIAAQAALPHERHPRAPVAAELLTTLELHDRLWLNLQYNEQWAQAQRRLQRIDTMDLRATIQEIAGEGFLTEVEFAHKAYGDALGITAQHPQVEDNVALVEPLRALAAAVAGYGLQLAAQYHNADAETRQAIVRALRPIDEHRARYARGGSSPAVPTPPAAPTPPAVPA